MSAQCDWYVPDLLVTNEDITNEIEVNVVELDRKNPVVLIF